MAIRIGPLRRSDYDAMIALFRVCGLNPKIKGRDSLPSFTEQLRRNADSYPGAFDGDRLVGTVLGTHDTRKGWINRLAVDPRYRRRAVAARLVRRCELVLRKNGVDMFAALVEPENKASAAFFRSQGYDILPITYARKKRRESV
ncbi:MAG: GNAT family N-acetyltransferase [Methanobacteriota archaeon]|nr:MAG: GNAT family N-acetyltransferase [Euryarchaeota archaeon]